MKTLPTALVWLFLSAALLAGCGQKGPLYLPGHAPESQTQGPSGSSGPENRRPRGADSAHDAAP